MPYKDKEKQRQAQRRYYEENKEKYVQANRDRRNAFRKAIDAAKTDVACMDCGIMYPAYIMDFDHRPDESKLFNISGQKMKASTLIRLLEEMAKCDIVCANCHRHRTWMRLHK